MRGMIIPGHVAPGNAYATLTRLAIAQNRPFYRYVGHIEFIRFEEYYGMPTGHSLTQRTSP